MGRTCGKLLRQVHVGINLKGVESRLAVFQNGWTKLGSKPDKPSSQLHLKVRVEPDPRFMFQFGGEPKYSPVIFQLLVIFQRAAAACVSKESTNGAAFFSQTLAVNDATVKFKIWDTAGQERNNQQMTDHLCLLCSHSTFDYFDPCRGRNSVINLLITRYLALRVKHD